MHPVASRLDTFQRRSSNSSCEAPAEEKLFCSCSSLSASVALMMQPSVPVMANETATAADLCYSCVRCVSLLSRARFLRFWIFFLSPRARLHTLYEMAAWSCMERCSGRRRRDSTVRVALHITRQPRWRCRESPYFHINSTLFILDWLFLWPAPLARAQKTVLEFQECASLCRWLRNTLANI